MNNYKKKAVLFLESQGITLFGSSLAQFALIWYVTGQTSSGGWVSAMTIAAFVPQFLVSCFSGVLADRYSKKKVDNIIGRYDSRCNSFVCYFFSENFRRNAYTVGVGENIGDSFGRDGDTNSCRKRCRYAVGAARQTDEIQRVPRIYGTRPATT